jgi:hypothetical protein
MLGEGNARLQAMTEGFQTAFVVGIGIAALGALLAFVLLARRPPVRSSAHPPASPKTA